MFPLILIFDFNPILGHFWVFGAKMNYFWAWDKVRKVFFLRRDGRTDGRTDRETDRHLLSYKDRGTHPIPCVVGRVEIENKM